MLYKFKQFWSKIDPKSQKLTKFIILEYHLEADKDAKPRKDNIGKSHLKLSSPSDWNFLLEGEDEDFVMELDGTITFKNNA